MKPSAILIPLATLVLGIAIGWIAKPAPASTEGPLPAKSSAASSTSPATPGDQPQPRPAKTDRSRPASDSEDEASSEDLETAEADSQKMMDQMRKAAIDRFRKKLESHLASLDESLSLTSQQKAQLQAAIDSQLAEVTRLMNSDGSQEAFNKLPSLGPAPLEAAIAATLTPEQKTALEAHKSKEIARQADTKALQKLALLQSAFDFKEGQRDEVYRILSESSARDLAKADPTASFNDVFSSGTGIEMDPYGLGLQQLIMESVQHLNENGGAAGRGEQAMKEAFRQKVDQLIEDRVNELKPILDEAQLEKYREELRTKGLGPYAAMFGADPASE